MNTSILISHHDRALLIPSHAVAFVHAVFDANEVTVGLKTASQQGDVTEPGGVDTSYTFLVADAARCLKGFAKLVETGERVAVFEATGQPGPVTVLRGAE